MLESHQVEELICIVSSLDREALTQQFSSFRGNFPVDFTPIPPGKLPNPVVVPVPT